MNITVQLNGTPIALPSIEQHPVLSGHAQCLLAVRAAQADSILQLAAEVSGQFDERFGSGGH